MFLQPLPIDPFLLLIAAIVGILILVIIVLICLLRRRRRTIVVKRRTAVRTIPSPGKRVQCQKCFSVVSSRAKHCSVCGEEL